MTKKPAPRTQPRIRRSFVMLGEHVSTARKLQGITMAQLAERAGISEQTLRALEHGRGGTSMEVFLRVARILGMLEILENAMDYTKTDVGFLRVLDGVPQRVRSRNDV